ncbi:hypothetical protein AB0L35_15685 [Streptomyces sp. NPDC052309]|uniref:hypothetical protein n=1 Tax=Streptomyces sp. NPDC052309 TaxID=3155421 RepID=UPI003421E2EE
MSLPEYAGPRADMTVYRWSERSLTGRGDVGPVTTSLDRDALLRWNSRIENMVWATQDHPGDTTPGFVYVRYEDEAAVLRKLPVRDPHGRSGSTLTHVLTGPAAGVDLHLALAACRSDWDDWLPPRARQSALLGGHAGPGHDAGRLPPVPLGNVRRLLLEQEPLLDALDAAAEDLPDALLARLAEALMAEPGTPLTVIGSPVPGEVVVHALAGLLGRVLAGGWTFATREENDGAKDLPRFVFVRGDGAGVPHTGRRRIDATADAGPGGPLRDQAARLIAFRRRRGPDALTRLLPAQPLASSAQVADWVTRHQVAPGVMSDVTSLLEAAPHGDLSPEEDAYLRSPAAVPRVQMELRRMSEGHLARLLTTWRTRGTATPSLRHLLREMYVEALHRCFDAAVHGGTSELEGVLAAGPPDGRLVQEVLDHRMELAGRRGEPFDVLPMFRAAGRIGIPVAELDDLTDVLVDRFATADLLGEVDRISRVAPAQARALLARCARRRGSSRQRRDPFDVLRRTRFLADAVDRMAPHAPRQAVDLYRLLLSCTVGDSPGQREVLAVLEAAGHSPSPALLRALLDTCRRGRAQDLVAGVVVEQYFREHLPGTPYDGEHAPSPRDPWH